MLRGLIVFSIFLVAVQAAAYFTVVSAPAGIVFDGDEPLEDKWLGEVFDASMGFSISGSVPWPALTIKDPFVVAKGIVVMMVDGVEKMNVNPNAISYKLLGNKIDKNIADIKRVMQSAGEATCELNFRSLEQGVKDFRSCYNKNVTVDPLSMPPSLNVSLSETNEKFKEVASHINAAAINLSKLRLPAHLFIVKISLAAIVKENGEDSQAVKEALSVIKSLTLKLSNIAQKSTKKQAFVVLITEKSGDRRQKREIFAGNAFGNKYNLAEYYTEDYPVIFNIILWFMVTFGFSLLAICYAIASMDPGRDSIIYRMTSTRMKKDN